ncbi:MAG TPA: nucleotidyltransferase [Terracidiphilus sp.]|nr:nucleotidyltransferase [Terracidiphilus sp.]
MQIGTLDGSALIDASKTEALDDVLIRVCNIFQLSSTQFSLAEKHYHAICDWLGADDSFLNPYRPDLYPQGSVALGTTVKPQRGEEYDVDLVCELGIDYRTVKSPVLLLDLIERRMQESDSYRERIERKKRCLRVNYEHDFHLDILPACPDPNSGPTCLVIPDREEGNWQASNPKGLLKWFRDRSALRLISSRTQKAMDSAAPLPEPQTADQKNTLQVSVQLVKRWRDLHFADDLDLAPVSVVLTTLLGGDYYGEQSVSLNLAASVDAIVSHLPAAGRLIVVNPAHPQEDLSERWNDDLAYRAFVEGIHALRNAIRELLACEDMGRRSILLQRMFGEDVTKKAFADQAKTIEAFRESQRMRIGRLASGVVSLSATGATPIPRNTFYGDAAK